MHYKDDITYKGKKYYVSTNCTFDRGWETMIFRRERNDEVNWSELYAELHGSEEDARQRHLEIISDIAIYQMGGSYGLLQ